MKSTTFQCLALAGSITLSVAAHADPGSNGGFEDGAFVRGANGAMSLGIGSTAISGWTVIGGNIAWQDNVNPFGISSFSGSKFLDLTDVFDTNPFGGVAQSISTIVGGHYLLQFELGSSAQYGRPASIQVTAGGTQQLFQSALGESGENTWEAFSLEFVAVSASTTIELLGVGSNQYIGLDAVEVSLLAAPVPEPGTWSLMLAGLGFAGRLRRRQKA